MALALKPSWPATRRRSPFATCWSASLVAKMAQRVGTGTRLAPERLTRVRCQGSQAVVTASDVMPMAQLCTYAPTSADVVARPLSVSRTIAYRAPSFAACVTVS